MILRYDQGMNTPNETPDHPLTETAAAELSKKFMPGVAFQILASVSPEDLTEYARLAYDLAREHEREHADPHHDPRPWQDSTREDIREGDLVEARIDDSLRIGVAHCQDEVGDWWTEGDYPLTHRDRWPLRRIPAPTPPAEEVELPREPGTVLRDVRVGHRRYEFAVKLYDGWRAYQGPDYVLHPDHNGKFLRTIDMDEFTLPDGTRARLYGEHVDWTPRFVKVQEEEK